MGLVCNTPIEGPLNQQGPTNAPNEFLPDPRIVEHEIPILDTAKFAAIVGIGPKFGYNSVQLLASARGGFDAAILCRGCFIRHHVAVSWHFSDAMHDPSIHKHKVSVDFQLSVRLSTLGPLENAQMAAGHSS